jgi:hypothetical protein
MPTTVAPLQLPPATHCHSVSAIVALQVNLFPCHLTHDSHVMLTSMYGKIPNFFQICQILHFSQNAQNT